MFAKLYARKFDEAEAAIKLAMKLAPGDATTRGFYAQFLQFDGKANEAIAYADFADLSHVVNGQDEGAVKAFQSLRHGREILAAEYTVPVAVLVPGPSGAGIPARADIRWRRRPSACVCFRAPVPGG